MNQTQKFKELIKLINFCNFQLFQAILKEILAIKNCEIAGWQER